MAFVCGIAAAFVRPSWSVTGVSPTVTKTNANKASFRALHTFRIKARPEGNG